jgi:hypothetical protein
VDPLELRRLKMPLDGSLEAKSSVVKRAATMVAQEYVKDFAMEVSEATKGSAIKRVADIVTQECVTSFAMQAASRCGDEQQSRKVWC